MNRDIFQYVYLENVNVAPKISENSVIIISKVVSGKNHRNNEILVKNSRKWKFLTLCLPDFNIVKFK